MKAITCRTGDGYAGYNRRLKRAEQDVELAYCWAHARRKLYEVTQNATAPIAEDGLKYIAKYRGGLNLFLRGGRIEMDNNPLSR